MPPIRTALLAAAAALVSVAAYAQPVDQPTMPSADTQVAPPDNVQTAPATAATTQVAGDVQVISSQPVPDTKANRAKYGQPMSRAGRRTAPIGN